MDFNILFEVVDKCDRKAELILRLLNLWELSVVRTHHFLNAEQIAGIKPYVPNALADVEYLVVARERGEIVGFMGINEQKLEMLFLHPDRRGEGIGGALVNFAVKHYDVNAVDVNEDNPEAQGFYEHMGFEVIARSEIDEQGNPFPILSMRFLGVDNASPIKPTLDLFNSPTNIRHLEKLLDDVKHKRNLASHPLVEVE